MKTIEQLPHFLRQIDVLLRRYFLLDRQIYSLILNRSSRFGLEALQIFKEKAFSLIVCDKVENCLLDSNIGDLLEVNAELVSLVVKLRVLV